MECIKKLARYIVIFISTCSFFIIFISTCGFFIFHVFVLITQFCMKSEIGIRLFYLSNTLDFYFLQVPSQNFNSKTNSYLYYHISVKHEILSMKRVALHTIFLSRLFVLGQPAISIQLNIVLYNELSKYHVSTFL